MSYISLSESAVSALVVSLITAILLAFTIRSITKQRSESSLQNELAKKDNFAMGISYAAWLFTSLVVSGFVLKSIHLSLLKHDILYGILILTSSFALIHLGRISHTRLTLNRFNEDKAILAKNVCAALIDAGIIIANGILVIGLYKWATPSSVYDFILVLIGFIICQIFITLQSRWYEYVFAKANQGERLQRSFVFDNTAIGLRYASQTIASALAIYAGLNIALFERSLLVDNILALLLSCGAVLILHFILSNILINIALPKINTESEIDQQDNIGIASVELAIYIAIGFLLVRVFSL